MHAGGTVRGELGGVFAETVFVAGGNAAAICGGQVGGVSERQICVAYPKNNVGLVVAVTGAGVEAIRGARQAREQAADQVIASGWEIELLERVYVLAAHARSKNLHCSGTTRCTTRRWTAGPQKSWQLLTHSLG